MPQPNSNDEPDADGGAGSDTGTKTGDRDSDSGRDGDSAQGTEADVLTGSAREQQSGSTTGSGPQQPNPDRDPRDESDQIANEERRRRTPFVSGIVVVLGAWVALSIFIYDVSQAGLWNNVLIGALVAVAAGYNYYRQYNDIPLSVGVGSLVALLGIWLVVASALFEMSSGLAWSTAVSGILIAALAGYNAYEAREARTVATDRDATR